MNKPLLSQSLAAFQLAAMQYEADKSDHKRQVMEQAETEYNQALLESDPEPLASQEPVASQDEKDAGFLREVLDHNEALAKEKQSLAEANETLKAENSLLKSQSIEKDQKIDELEKSIFSVKPTAEESAPAATPARPMTGAAKAAATDDSKKNS